MPSEEFIRESLREWTQKLRKETRRVSRLRRALHKAKAARQRAAAKRRLRQRQLKHLHAKSVQHRVLDAALSYKGITERPADSNHGPVPIDECQAEFGFSGVAWCGCFVGWILRRVGGLTQMNSRIAYTPAIVDDAKAGRNGLKCRVPVSESRPGDLWVFHFGSGGAKHVGFFVRWANAAKTLAVTIEGNTSFDDAGSQANGGAVAQRTRSVSLVLAAARPAYA